MVHTHTHTVQVIDPEIWCICTCISLISVLRLTKKIYDVFLWAILILPCASSSLAFCMMYSACKLNKQDDNTQPWQTPFPTWNQSVHCSVFSSNCCFLTCIQVLQEAGKVVWYSQFLKNFPKFIVIHTIKGISIFNETEELFFLEFSCFFYDPANVGSLIPGSSAFCESILYIWKFLVHILLKPTLKNFEHYLPACEMSMIVQ